MTMPPLPEPIVPASALVESASGVFAAMYCAEQMHAYGAACAAQEREAIAEMLDEEQRQDRWNNHAGVFARMVRARGEE